MDLQPGDARPVLGHGAVVLEAQPDAGLGRDRTTLPTTCGGRETKPPHRS
jgi:hypothetical protein